MFTERQDRVRLMKNNAPLNTPEKNQIELVAKTGEFAEKRRPILQAVQIA